MVGISEEWWGGGRTKVLKFRAKEESKRIRFHKRLGGGKGHAKDQRIRGSGRERVTFRPRGRGGRTNVFQKKIRHNAALTFNLEKIDIRKRQGGRSAFKQDATKRNGFNIGDNTHPGACDVFSSGS